MENLTYRWPGHSKSDGNRYRTKGEIEERMARDPIARFRAELIAHGVVDDAVDEMAAGIGFAKASRAASVSEVTRYVDAEN